MLTEQRVAAAMILGLLLCATVTGLLVMLHQYRAGRTLMDVRQLLIRCLGGFQLALIWLFLGAMLLVIRPLEQPRLFLACFWATLLLAVALVPLALVDLRCTLARQAREEVRLAEEFIQLFARTAEPSHEP